VETVQDPVNGVYVGTDTEFKVKYYDKLYYFSSKESMDEFIAQKKGEEK
jgi:YHS domain-containing protein